MTAMPINKRAIAVTQLVLIFPAAVFMAALLVRNLQPFLYEPAHTAQLIVAWYSGRVWTLWILLAGLPSAVLVIGCITLLKVWRAQSKPEAASRKPSTSVRLSAATLMISALTLLAAATLMVVGVHVLMN